MPDPLLTRQTLVFAILKQVDHKKTLLRSRLVSKSCCELVTPRAFQVLKVSRKKKSRNGLRSIANDAQLSYHVKEVAFEEGDTEFDFDENARQLASCIRNISRLTNLTTLRMSFPEECFSDDRRPPAQKLQYGLFKMLSEVQCDNLPGLERIELQNLLATSDNNLCKIKPFLKQIKTFILSGLTQDRGYSHIREGKHRDFWDNDVCMSLAAAERLTSLTLTSDVITYNTWSSIGHLPSLEHLALENFVFSENNVVTDHDIQCLDAYIIEHKKTLKHLDLTMCWLDFTGQAANLCSWAKVFRNFAKELTELRSFTFDPMPGPEYGVWNGYVWLNDLIGIYTNDFDESIFGVPDKGDDDGLAYDFFQVAIAKRIGSSAHN